jgi:hypothetical protein
MTMRYTVGMTVDAKSRQVEVEAEDALIAALRAKAEQPDALIVYVRKANARGDKRHPHRPAEPSGLPKRRAGASGPAPARPVRSAARPPRQPRGR